METISNYITLILVLIHFHVKLEVNSLVDCLSNECVLSGDQDLAINRDNMVEKSLKDDLYTIKK
jgi:hypothetical protein